MNRWTMTAALLALAAQAGNAQETGGQERPSGLRVVLTNADGLWGYCWVEGQVLTYRAEHETKASEVTADGKSETKTKLTLTKRWQVKAADQNGVATLQHSLVALRMETVTPGGETLLFDSAALDKSDPRLREQLNKLIGVPLSTLRINNRGKVVAVEESKFGPASRYEAEPPFVLVLPPTAVKPGQSWERAYQITQEPPLGAGEKYPAAQTYTCTKLEGPELHVTLTTALKAEPKSLADRVPLLQYQPEGTVVFDVKNGRLISAKLTVKKELKGHAGEGSSYKFESTYSEQIVP